MQTTENNELEELYLALEAFSNEANFAVNIGNFVARKSANLVLNINKGLKRLIAWDFPLFEDLSPSTTRFYLNRGVDYSEHVKLPVGKPFGLKVEMIDYTTVLLGRAVVLNEIVDVVIEDSINRIASYINDPSLRAERRFTSLNKVDLEKLKKEETKYFLNTRQADGLFGELYNSFNDFITAEETMLQLRAKIEDGRLDKVKAKVENLNVLSETLIKAIEKKDVLDHQKPSREFIKHLSEELLYVAKCIEYYSIQMARIIETNNVLHETEKQLRSL